MFQKVMASTAAAEPLLGAAIVGIGVGTDSPGLAVFGALWYAVTIIDRIRRRA